MTLYADTVGSVSFHPLHPLILSVSGARHFDFETVTLGPNSDSSDSSNSDDELTVPMVRDAAMKIWNFSYERSSSST